MIDFKYYYRYLRYNLLRERWRVFVSFDGGKPYCVKMGTHSWHKDFCADCFLFAWGEELYLFYETVDKNNKGLLGGFKYSREGQWIQLGAIHNPPWHTSYPQVFSENGRVYMIPEQSAGGRGNVSLYEAKDFPFRWEKVSTLIDRPYADATVLKHNGHYYMACYAIPPHESASLWHAPSLLGPWVEHPESKNISQSPKYRRCGGAFEEFSGQLFRIAQDCDGGYGLRLYKIPILALSPTQYREGRPVLLKDACDDPREDGKHTFNRVFWNGHVVECFDTKKYKFRPFMEILRFVRKAVFK